MTITKKAHLADCLHSPYQSRDSCDTIQVHADLCKSPSREDSQDTIHAGDLVQQRKQGHYSHTNFDIHHSDERGEEVRPARLEELGGVFGHLEQERRYQGDKK